MEFKNPQYVTTKEARKYFMATQHKNDGWHCLVCDQLGAVTRRQNTQYQEDISNWTCLCEECAKENYEHWQEMWREYYDAIR